VGACEDMKDTMKLPLTDIEVGCMTDALPTSVSSALLLSDKPSLKHNISPLWHMQGMPRPLSLRLTQCKTPPSASPLR
jgi:hypothetical protein